MNRPKILKWLGYAIATFCMIGLGFFWGYREGLSGGGFSASMAELQASADGLSLQLEEGTCQTAKKAINAHLGFIERYKGKNELILSETTYNSDKMLGHMRLFLIERHEGNTKEASVHLKAAVDACQHAEMKDCSEKSVLLMAEKWNQSQPMGCLTSPK